MRKTAYLTLLLSFMACYLMTSPGYIGDTTRYAREVIDHAEGREAQFWEFGHLLWRPWGFVGYLFCGHWYAQSFGDDPAQTVDRFLIQTNVVCSAAALLLLMLLLRKVVRAKVAWAAVFAMSCSAAYLNYCHSGAPYIPALVFSIITLLLLTTAVRLPGGGHGHALLAGVSFAVACALWFPYSFTGLGMLAVLYRWPPKDSAAVAAVIDGSVCRRRLIFTFLVSVAVSAFFLFATGAAANGIRNVSQLPQWVRESDNGWSQSATAMRAVTGLPRAVWDFGDETVLLKRWLFRDPYNPVHVSTLMFTLGLKLAAFYLGIGAALLILWREHRVVLFILVAGGLPLLLFSITVFEPSSPERFLPVFPFAYLAVAVVLDKASSHAIPSGLVALLLVGYTVYNLTANSQISGDPRVAEAKLRIQALNNNVQPEALVFVVTYTDEMILASTTHPLDNSLARLAFRVQDAVTIANRRTAQWRTVFAESTLAQWAQDREVWVSERLLANRPEARWRWVEGDDRRIHWSDLPAAFGQLDRDRRIQVGMDGFLRLAESQANRELLTKWAATDGEPH
ncbi:MAG: hypothetical protein JST11_00535 [Acidobacteria bacterium]|nr:hypothetical protein [Acidobacteriota bacterium]